MANISLHGDGFSLKADLSRKVNPQVKEILLSFIKPDFDAKKINAMLSEAAQLQHNADSEHNCDLCEKEECKIYLLKTADFPFLITDRKLIRATNYDCPEECEGDEEEKP